jgi:hypothetical protein
MRSHDRCPPGRLRPRHGVPEGRREWVNQTWRKATTAYRPASHAIPITRLQ